MTAQPTPHRLDVPGAQLYYEVRGTGPLLLVVGQPMTSEPFGPVADLLAADHTVVTYDPRGLGESTAEDPTSSVTPEVEADDLARLIDAVGGGPADVFATSGGAVAALALVGGHPGKVRTLIAHEPPVTELLPDAPHIRAAVDGVVDAYRAHGSDAGWAKFVSLVVHGGPVTEAGVPDFAWPPAEPDATAGQPDGEPVGDQPPAGHSAPSAKQQADDQTFFLRMLEPFTRYQPDIDTLRASPARVVIAIGETSRDEAAARSTLALAERLGTSPMRLPGDHAGFLAEPAGFADAIRRVLTRS